eukprot:SAG22_NODE_8472_length_653_cov_1.402527_1_plen_114_part_10
MMALRAVARALGAAGDGDGLCSCAAVANEPPPASGTDVAGTVRLAVAADRARVVETIALAFDASPEMNFFFRPRPQFDQVRAGRGGGGKRRGKGARGPRGQGAGGGSTSRQLTA